MLIQMLRAGRAYSARQLYKHRENLATRVAHSTLRSGINGGTAVSGMQWPDPIVRHDRLRDAAQANGSLLSSHSLSRLFKEFAASKFPRVTYLDGVQEQ
jgi:class 3 adenylate cyclase